MSDLNPGLQAIKASLAAAFPAPVTVQRSLADPMALSAGALAAGVICIVAGGGGDFGNWLGREGEEGHADVTLVVFLKVAEGTQPEAIEQAELAWLASLTAWCKTGPYAPAQDVLPGRFTLSKQLEHPYGWLLLELDVQF